MGVAAAALAKYAVPLAMTALSAGAQYVNTRNTAKNADQALAGQIRNQGRIQQKADVRVGEEVSKLEQSRSDEHRAEAMASYMDTLRKGRARADAGLTPNIGSDVFKQDAAQAVQDVQAEAGDRAGLMARVDAPGMQRQEEAFGYGRLGTDLNLLAREAGGQDFLDQLRVRRASERSAGLDALSALLGGAAGAVKGGKGKKVSSAGHESYGHGGG